MMKKIRAAFAALIFKKHFYAKLKLELARYPRSKGGRHRANFPVDGHCKSAYMGLRQRIVLLQGEVCQP